jgi:hypothetical protein
VVAGQRAGTQAVLVLTGRGADQAPELAPAGLAEVPVAADLAAALARWLKKTPPARGGKASIEAILP